MKTGDITELAFRNLREAILRNSLTTLGVAVGVASLVAMLSVGVGLQQFAAKRLASSGLFNAIFVASRADRGFEARRPSEGNSASKARPPDESARHDLPPPANVTKVYPQIRFMTEVRYGTTPYPTSVAGVPDSGRSDGAFDGMKGSFFSGPNADEAILQSEFAKELATDASTLLGKTLILRYAKRASLPISSTNSSHAQNSQSKNAAPSGFSVIPEERALRIVGIIDTEPEGGFGGFGRSRVFIPLSIAEDLSATSVSDLQQLVSGSSASQTYSSLTVRVKSPT